MAEGVAVLGRAMAQREVGEYQLQAAIAAVHDRAATADATDWREICVLYELLEGVTGSAVVTLNRAVAVAMADGPVEGLRVVDGWPTGSVARSDGSACAATSSRWRATPTGPPSTSSGQRRWPSTSPSSGTCRAGRVACVTCRRPEAPGGVKHAVRDGCRDTST